MKYKVDIKETLFRSIEIESNSIEEAIDDVREQRARSEIILEADDFLEVEFDARENIPPIQVLVIAPGKKPELREIENTLQDMRDIVDGYIEAVSLDEQGTLLICNEEGKLRGLTCNRAIREEGTGEIKDIIHGTFFLCGESKSGENFDSLNYTQIEMYQERFKYPERIRMGMYGYSATPIKEYSKNDRGR